MHHILFTKQKACECCSGLTSGVLAYLAARPGLWCSSQQVALCNEVFVAILCSAMLLKSFLLDATSKCLKLQGRKEEIMRWGVGSSGDRQTGLKQVVKKPVLNAFPN